MPKGFLDDHYMFLFGEILSGRDSSSITQSLEYIHTYIMMFTFRDDKVSMLVNKYRKIKVPTRNHRLKAHFRPTCGRMSTLVICKKRGHT